MKEIYISGSTPVDGSVMSVPDCTGTHVQSWISGFVPKCLDIEISQSSCMIDCVKWNSMPVATR